MKAMADVIPDSQKILNDALGFRTEIPKDYEKNERDSQGKDILYSYIRIREDGEVFTFNIQRLRGRIRDESIREEDIALIKNAYPPGAAVETFDTLWQDYILAGYTVSFRLGDLDITSHSIQIPLAREAIQMNVGSSSLCHQESKVLLRTLLRGLKGISNWQVLQEDQ